MATSTGREVGRVSIRVLPNSTKFRADLKKVLDRVEATMSATIEVHAGRREFDREITRMVHDAEKNSVTLNADADTGRARQQIAMASRSRFVNFTVRVSKSSLASAATALAAISGARLAGTVLQDIGRGLSNLDKNLPKLAAVGLGVANLASTLLSSVGGIVTVGGGLVSVLGLLGAAPGVLAGAAVGIITLAVALKDAKTQLAELGPQWTNLGSIISSNFWDRARQPIIDLNNDLFPSLEAGLSSTATALGNWTASLASGFQKALGGGRIDYLFGKLNESIDTAAGGTGAFASALVLLSEIGINNLPRLASWVSKITTSFDLFVQRIASDGTLQTWIDNGVDGAKDLGRALKGVGGILAGVYKAAEASGGQGLSFLADTLQKVSDIVNGAQFQEALTTLFVGAAEGVNGLADALGPIGDLFADLAPTISEILSSSGGTLGDLFGDIADALNDPVFATGLTAFFDGIQRGIDAIGPSLPLVAEVLGKLGGVLGTVAAAAGPLIGALVDGLAPILVDLLENIEPLIPVLGEALTDAMGQLQEPLADLAEALFPKLVELIEALLPLIPPLTELLVLLLPALTDIAENSDPVIEGLSGIAGGIAELLKLLEGDSSLDEFKDKILALPGPMGTSMNAAYDMSYGIGSAMRQIIGASNSTQDAVVSAFSGMADSARSMGVRIGEGISDAVGFLVTLPARAAGALGDLGGILVSSGRSLIGGFIDGIRSMISEVAAAASAVAAAAGAYFPHSPAKKGPFSGRGWTLYSGRALSRGFADGIRSSAEIAAVGSSAMRVANAADVFGMQSSVGSGFSAGAVGGQQVTIYQTNEANPEEDPRLLGRIHARELVAQMAGAIR
jgi:hypothetical protein